MAVLARNRPTPPRIGDNSRTMRPPVTYAITFDLDTQILEDLHPNASWKNAYSDIRGFLDTKGFDHVQGSVYFGRQEIDVVTCIVAAQELALAFDWFEPSVKDIRMLRIEENNDLLPALSKAVRSRTKKS